MNKTLMMLIIELTKADKALVKELREELEEFFEKRNAEQKEYFISSDEKAKEH